MKKIIITGSAGFAGSHMVEHFIANTDWKIIGIDSFRHRGDSLRVYHDPKRYEIYTHDLSTPISNRLINKIGDVDYIINNAAESHVDRSIEDPVPFVQNNINVALNMLEYAKKVGVSKFVQISTDEVYGPALEGTLHKEWSTIAPSNPYAGSKACQEALAISYWRTYGIPLILTNTMNLIGERQDSEKFIPMLICKIYNDETVTIHGNEDYIGTRFYLHARNQADGQLFLLKNREVTKYKYDIKKFILPDRFNIVGELELNNLQLAQMVADAMGKKLKYRLVDFHKARPGHDRRYALDGEMMSSLGWNPPVPFQKSLEKTIKWTLDHKEWLVYA
jgi:dTDP-glucose 4,6-dehydratase